MLRVKGPCIVCCPLCGVNFNLMDPIGQKVGIIKKQFSGFKEFFSDADNYYITFPMDLDVRMKATLLGALIMIDFVHFETGGGH